MASYIPHQVSHALLQQLNLAFQIFVQSLYNTRFLDKLLFLPLLSVATLARGNAILLQVERSHRVSILGRGFAAPDRPVDRRPWFCIFVGAGA
jgi:hypothetical protein